MRIALLGTRGIPARYGGFETFAEEISKELAARGHQVTVFGRRKFFQAAAGPSSIGDVALEYTPTIMHKYLETPLHSLTSFCSLFGKKYDVVLLCNAANSPFAWIGRLCGLPVAINVDGVERRRSKWNALGRMWYRLGEISSVLFGSAVISDAETIARYYHSEYGATSQTIAYGAAAEVLPAGETLSAFGLKSRGYVLYVSRLEPENNALGVVRAYAESGLTVPLVIVGDAPYANNYIAAVKREATENVRFTGYQFGKAYKELQSNALLYIQATEVGGTHPALIEAMAHGNCIIANGTPENFEVLGGAGAFYRRNDFEDLAERLHALAENPDVIEQYRNAARARANTRFTWSAVAAEYEELLSRLAV